MDLRPIYEKINPLKYDVVLCPHCGYSALERYFKTVTQVQKQLIQEKICANYKEREEKETFSYEDGFLRYKMAMMNCMVKQAYDESEKAYVCLRAAWMLRAPEGKSDRGSGQAGADCKAGRRISEKNAKEGFAQANIKEDYPLCGMDETTVDYLMAALSCRFWGI